MSNEIAAFMSYAHFDDEHDNGQLSWLRKRLASEVRAQTGQKFVIFQDRADIAWGENWRQRIDETLDVVTLLLVVITPGFFASATCRAEVTRFRQREQELGRSDLILPIYYISAREMDDAAARESDEIARLLASRQFADWRALRFKSFISPLVRKAIAHLASRVRDTFWHSDFLQVSPMLRHEQQVEEVAGTDEGAGARDRIAVKIYPPTHMVDVLERGDFITLSQAIDAANPGDRILVRPGLYEEGLIVAKPLEILGDGPASEIVIRARNSDALLFLASFGRVANLTLHQAGDGMWSGVDITLGRLDLEDCDISSDKNTAVTIREGADPRLRRNRIHTLRGIGVSVQNGGLGMLEDNDIYDNIGGVEIMGGNLTLRRNQIHDNGIGVFVGSEGLGRLEDNDISRNIHSGVKIVDGGNPTLRRNQIREGAFAGVEVYSGGFGKLEDNDIAGNAGPGVMIESQGNPVLRHNQIRDGKSCGVFVYDHGLGVLEDNHISGNTLSGVDIKRQGSPALRRNRIVGNDGCAVTICDGGGGVLEDNDLTGNGRPFCIADDCKAHVRCLRNKE